MTRRNSRRVILANGAKGPASASKAIVLNYLENDPNQNVNIGLPEFVQDVFHIEDRVLDLLELASYIYAADRLILRGEKDAVEYHSWGRSLDFHVRVRDYEFWNHEGTRALLSDALLFMTGDAEIQFQFEPGHSTPPTSLFDSSDFTIEPDRRGIEVALFSGGIDSLSGAIDLLSASQRQIVLVSHRSQPSTVHSQNALVDALKARFPRRIVHYKFGCTLKGIRRVEETQRSRSFLYTCIAYAIAAAYGSREFKVYENGITSINLRRREDLANARASRTTHPQTMEKLASLFTLIGKKKFTIRQPYLLCTKGDVIGKVGANYANLLSSSVSCSRTFNVSGQATHCGYCFQCVDRRIAAHAVRAEKEDHRGLYANDIIVDPIIDGEAKTTAVDYIRQAISFSEGSPDMFYSEYLTDLAEVLDYVDLPGDDMDKVTILWKLFQRHGCQVREGIERMRLLNENVFGPVAADSLLGLVSSREYLKPEVERCAQRVEGVIRESLADMFRTTKPKDENDLNLKLGALLRSHESIIASEHPTVSFACASVVPDHTWEGTDLLIEAKYIRGATSPSKASEGIAADLTKYPQEAFVVFVVYDPEHAIRNDSKFERDIHGRGRNRVLIIR